MKNSDIKLLLLAIALGVLPWATPSQAAVITTNPNLPPIGGVYESSPGDNATFNSIPTVDLSLLRLQAVSINSVTPSGPDEIEDFQSDLDSMASVNGGPAGPTTANGSALVRVDGKIGNVTGTFNTEMLTLNLTGSAPISYMIRESPTQQSLGQTTITNIGGGLYSIDSFFDIFMQLSTDGGATWAPDSSGPVRVTLVPEPKSAALLLGSAAALLLRRRRALTV